MTYKLNPEVKKILAPITIRFTSGEADLSFPDGVALAEANFNKNYLIDSLSVEYNSIVITLQVRDKLHPVNWIGEEAVSVVD